MEKCQLLYPSIRAHNNMELKSMFMSMRPIDNEKG
jgi:hypothetical protein